MPLQTANRAGKTAAFTDRNNMAAQAWRNAGWRSCTQGAFCALGAARQSWKLLRKHVHGAAPVAILECMRRTAPSVTFRELALFHHEGCAMLTLMHKSTSSHAEATPNHRARSALFQLLPVKFHCSTSVSHFQLSPHSAGPQIPTNPKPEPWMLVACTPCVFRSSRLTAIPKRLPMVWPLVSGFPFGCRTTGQVAIGLHRRCLHKVFVCFNSACGHKHAE